jgi:hypothetical protein
MATLTREQRKLLENTVVAARDTAERGADKILTSLRAGKRDAPEKLSPKDTALRNQLRAHGRQLGDKRHPNGEQETTRLKQACAYEHWHRLLFARFLAENDLLLNPEYGVAMSLSEIQETARANNRDWLSIASDYAQQMLLEVFRPDDPVLQVVMPPENRQELEEQLAQLGSEIFTAEDSLGWVYQFWQRDEKERVDKSEVKIGADELSPVTQLFTEDYMVLFLLHNTLGAWWTAKRRAEGKDPRFPDYEWTYLRLNEDGSPSAGNFDDWPKTSRLLRVLDPCMGSGHFLTFALPIVGRMRQEEDGSTLAEAVHKVLAENLFGLELDARCSQIAAFNLALTAWRMVGRPIQLPAMNLACSGLGINASRESWIALAGDKGLERDTLSELYTTFQKAPTLGSLIDPARVGRPLLVAKFDEIWPLLERALSVEQQGDESRELAIAARGVLSVARMLTSKFTLVATNVPYLGRGKQHDDLKEHCGEFHTDAKAELATTFLDRCLRFSCTGGSSAVVIPQNWLFQGTYTSFRRRLLATSSWNLVAKLGPAAFEDMNWWAANTLLLVLTHGEANSEHSFAGMDVSEPRDPKVKAQRLQSGATKLLLQRDQLSNPDARILLESMETGRLLSEYASSFQGISPADFPHYGRDFWEIGPSDEWCFWQGSINETTAYGGRELVLWWSKDLKNDVKEGSAYLRGQQAWGKRGVVVRQMRHLPCTLYTGEWFDTNCAAIIPKSEDLLLPLWAFCSSDQYAKAVRVVDQKTNVTNSTLVKVPFDLKFWQSQAEELYPAGLPSPKSNAPTQWLFDGHPMSSENPLQVAVARLVGYRWPRQNGSSFDDCPAVEPDGLEIHADSDGIACLSSLSGIAPAADRLRALLSDAFGSEWSAARLAKLVGDCESLEIWLRDHFFAEHCDLFDNRPFVWHVWDGRKDGFHALVNYHKLAGPRDEGRKTLEKLIYTSLGDWISRQRAEVVSGADGAEARLSAALQLQSELEKVLEGKPPYDIFVRWKPIHEQAIGWEPDLNDGVRLNMRPWLMAKPYEASKKDACILRISPIKLPLGKDRGKEPDRDKAHFPWFAETRDRNNDIHLTLDQKRNAKDRKKA